MRPENLCESINFRDGFFVGATTLAHECGADITVSAETIFHFLNVTLLYGCDQKHLKK